MNTMNLLRAVEGGLQAQHGGDRVGGVKVLTLLATPPGQLATKQSLRSQAH